jgi:hypothetical protein
MRGIINVRIKMLRQTPLQTVRYLVPIIACLTLALFSCSKAVPPEPPEAKDAVAAFQKIDSRVELGINITDYLSQVSDAKLALEKYKSIPDNNQKITQPLEFALNAHVSALDFWNCKIQNTDAGTLAQCQTPKLEAFANQYPKVKIYMEELKKEEPDGGGGSVFWRIDTSKVLSALWSEAKTETTQAQTQSALN